MATTFRMATEELACYFEADNALAAEYDLLAQLTGQDNVGFGCPPPSIQRLHITPEVLEKSAGAKYPAVHIYCEKVNNTLTEKFRVFSGTADLHIELRVTHDHADTVTRVLELYAEAVTNLLERKRGRWNASVHYPGGYEVHFGPIKRGGKNFIQSAHVKLQVHIGLG